MLPGHLENYDGDNSRINYYNSKLEKGLSSYNQPLNDTLTLIYDLPVGHGRRFDTRNKYAISAVGGWSLDMINTMTSGLPLIHQLLPRHPSRQSVRSLPSGPIWLPASRFILPGAIRSII